MKKKRVQSVFVTYQGSSLMRLKEHKIFPCLETIKYNANTCAVYKYLFITVVDLQDVRVYAKHRRSTHILNTINLNHVGNSHRMI